MTLKEEAQQMAALQQDPESMALYPVMSPCGPSGCQSALYPVIRLVSCHITLYSVIFLIDCQTAVL